MANQDIFIYTKFKLDYNIGKYRLIALDLKQLLVKGLPLNGKPMTKTFSLSAGDHRLDD